MKKNRVASRFSWPALIALAFLLITYIVMNCRWSVSGEKLTLKYFELAREWLMGERVASMADSVLLIDVHYDKRLVLEHKILPNDTIAKGKTPITDRQKLYQLLEYLKDKDYRYILLDVALDEEASQPEDSALYQLIGTMRDIAIPFPMRKQLADSCLETKAGMAQYGTTIWENDFVKYPYLTDGVKSIPLKMYEELTGRSIKGYWPFYFDGLSLARRSVILTYELRVKTVDEIEEEAELSDGNMPIYDSPVDLGISVLGEQLDTTKNSNEDEPLINNPTWANGKYVLIGDYISDRHTTYMGEVAGTVINFNAYWALYRGHHRISLLFILTLFAAYFILSWLIINHHTAKSLTQKYIRKVWKRYKKPWQRRLLHCLKYIGRLLTWLSYPTFLVVLCLITYLWLGEVYDVLLAITLFFLLKKAILWHHRLKVFNKYTKIKRIKHEKSKNKEHQ